MNLDGRVIVREKKGLTIASIGVNVDNKKHFVTMPINFKKETKEKVLNALKRSKDKDPRLTLDIKGFISAYVDKNDYHQPTIVALEVSLPKLENPKVKVSKKEEIEDFEEETPF